jgi:hypothetical protein
MLLTLIAFVNNNCIESNPTKIMLYFMIATILMIK